jgi:hypothetical protein
MKKFAFALLAMATALVSAPAALAGSLCPNVAWTGGSNDTVVTASGSCGAVTLFIPNSAADGASLYWGSSSYGATGLTVGNLASFNTSVSFNPTGAGDQPFYELDFRDSSDSLGQASGSDTILMLEFQSGNVSGNNMLLDPNATLFNVLDNTTGVYLEGGQSNAHTLAYWLALDPNLSSLPTWVGIGMGEGGSGKAESLTINSANYAEYAATPEPSSLLLLFTGMMGLAFVIRRPACF